MTHPIDDDPMTDQRKAAIANATRAQQNCNELIRDMVDSDLPTPELMYRIALMMAQTAQVFATLDLADATREQTAALEAIDEGRRLGR
jgi:hypothetical protein